MSPSLWVPDGSPTLLKLCPLLLEWAVCWPSSWDSLLDGDVRKDAEKNMIIFHILTRTMSTLNRDII